MSAVAVQPPEVQARLIAALGLARRGFLIATAFGVTPDGGCRCPLGAFCPTPGKHGGTGWKEHATADAGEIRTRFLLGDPNYGVIPAAGSRLVVVDEDLPGALDDLGPLPHTLTVRTGLKPDGARGRHVYGRLPAGVEEGDLPYRWAGGEVRFGGNGQAIGPYSRHRSGVLYEPVDDAKVEELPEPWLRALIASAVVATTEQNAARSDADPGWVVTEPGRHPFLVARARNMRGLGLSGERLRDELRRINDERCRPPKSQAEVDDIASWTNGKVSDDPPGDFPDARPDGIVRLGISIDDFLHESTDTVPWAVDGVAVDGGVVAVLGRPESFKTQGMMHLGIALAGAAPDWLGLRIGEPRPFIYISAEKSRATVREKFRRMTSTLRPTQDVRVIHREGVTFGDARKWDQVVSTVADCGPRTCAVLDTVASLAGTGFNENDGKDMAVVLGAVRQLVDAGATVFLLHHPAKHGEGTGGVRLRGHSSLWGEVDGVIEFNRPDRETEAGTIRAEPKDGDFALLRFTWSRETFLLEPDTDVRILTARTVADVVDVLYDQEPLHSDRIAAQFSSHKRSAFLEKLSEAVRLGLVRRVGQSVSTRYLPTGRNRDFDDPD